MLPTGLPFILKSDLDILAYNKEPMALCVFLRKLAVEQGLADVDIEFHVSVGKVLPAAATWLSGECQFFRLAIS